jgi:hypothetical protein
MRVPLEEHVLAALREGDTVIQFNSTDQPSAVQAELSCFNNGSWELIDTVSNAAHVHSEIEFIKINGVSGSVVVSGKRITFTSGILTGFEDA